MNLAPLPGEVHPLLLLAVALAPPLLLWFGLAVSQALRTDPDRARRRGQKALQRLIRRCRGRSPSRLELEIWRELCVETWGLSESVPRVTALAAALPVDADPAAWARLWDEAERALYSGRSALAADWTQRALDRAAALPPWPAMPWLPTRCRHWLPPRASTNGSMPGTIPAPVMTVRCALIALMLVAGGLKAAAPAVERAVWLHQLAQQPGDWTAHQQLGLSYAHEDQWGLAAGHGTAAFLLNPAAAGVAAQFRRGLDKLDGADPRLTELASGHGAAGLAARCSAARWQQILGWSAAAGAIGLMALVWSRYFPGRGYVWAGFALACCAGAAVIAAASALRVYGPLANPRAALVVRRAEVRSIPSDLVAKESATTLPSGAVVMVIRSFFGWDQVVIEGGTVGWARTDALMWIYRHRDDSVPARELP